MSLFLVGMAVHPVFGREEEYKVSYCVDEGSEHVIEDVVGFCLFIVSYDILTLAFLRILSFFIPCYLYFIPWIESSNIYYNPEKY